MKISSCLFGLAFVIVSCYGDPDGVYHAQKSYGSVDSYVAPSTPAYGSPLNAAPSKNYFLPGKCCQSALRLIRPNNPPPTAIIQGVHYPRYRPRYLRKHRKNVTKTPSIFTRIKDIIVGKVTFIKNGFNYIAKNLGGAIVGISETKAKLLRSLYERIYGENSSSEISDEELNEILDEYSDDKTYGPPILAVASEYQPLPSKPTPGSVCYNCKPTFKTQPSSEVQPCPTCYLFPPANKNYPAIKAESNRQNIYKPVYSASVDSTKSSSNANQFQNIGSYSKKPYSDEKSSSESQAYDFVVPDNFVRDAGASLKNKK